MLLLFGCVNHTRYNNYGVRLKSTEHAFRARYLEAFRLYRYNPPSTVGFQFKGLLIAPFLAGLLRPVASLLISDEEFDQRFPLRANTASYTIFDDPAKTSSTGLQTLLSGSNIQRGLIDCQSWPHGGGEGNLLHIHTLGRSGFGAL